MHLCHTHLRSELGQCPGSHRPDSLPADGWAISLSSLFPLSLSIHPHLSLPALPSGFQTLIFVGGPTGRKLPSRLCSYHWNQLHFTVSGLENPSPAPQLLYPLFPLPGRMPFWKEHWDNMGELGLSVSTLQALLQDFCTLKMVSLYASHGLYTTVHLLVPLSLTMSSFLVSRDPGLFISVSPAPNILHDPIHFLFVGLSPSRLHPCVFTPTVR